MKAAKQLRCLGHLELSSDGRLDGWCCLPDRPDHRAVVDIVVDGEAVQSVIATRLRPDLRDLGIGDGYCGFQVPLLARPASAVRVVEARERSLGFVFGRVLMDGDQQEHPADPRLRRVSERLAVAAAALTDAYDRGAVALAEPFGLLGQAILRQAGGHTARAAASPAALAAAHREVSRIAVADLGHVQRPAISIVTRPAATVDGLALALRQAAAAFAGVGADFLLLDDGSDALAALLPTRLRSLGLIRQQAGQGEGAFLNAALCAARGRWLAVVSDPTRMEAAGLATWLGDAPEDTVHVGAAIGRLLREARLDGLDEAPAGEVGWDASGVACVVERQRFARIGGFRERADDQAADIWVDFAARAQALGLRLVVWPARRRFRGA